MLLNVFKIFKKCIEGSVYMKYPNLKSMPVDSLILLAKQKNNEEFTLYVKQIVLDYHLSNTSFINLLHIYKNSIELKRKILANVIAIKLVDEVFIIDMDTLKQILIESDIEYLWVLSKSCNIEIVKSLAFDEIMKRLETIEEDSSLNIELQQKIADDTIYLKRINPNSNGGSF